MNTQVLQGGQPWAPVPAQGFVRTGRGSLRCELHFLHFQSKNHKERVTGHGGHKAAGTRVALRAAPGARLASAARGPPPLPASLCLWLTHGAGTSCPLSGDPYKGQVGISLVHIGSQRPPSRATTMIPRHGCSSGKPPTPGRPGGGAHEYFIVEFSSSAASQAALCLILPSWWLTPSPPLPLVNSGRPQGPFAAKELEVAEREVDGG